MEGKRDKEGLKGIRGGKRRSKGIKRVSDN
jgi:hypothetical protein